MNTILISYHNNCTYIYIKRKLYSHNDYKENCTHIMIARGTSLFRNSDRTVPWTGALDRAVKYEKYYNIINNTDALGKVVKYGAC